MKKRRPSGSSSSSSSPALHSRARRASPPLLRYLVEETLAGRGDQLKEYTLGTAVLGVRQIQMV